MEAYINLEAEDSTVKTLGIQYYPRTDNFGFKISPLVNVKYTKRGMLSVAASIYDPIGWILPVIMMFRILIQNLWANNLNWDDLMDDKLKSKFQTCLSSLPKIAEYKVPRWISSKINKVDLIGFSDASGDGIAAVVYSRVKAGNEFVIRLIAAKGKVTPLKTKKNRESKLCTIPKM